MADKKFIQKATAKMKKKGTLGTFKAAAKKKGLTTAQMETKVLKKGSKATKKMKKKAQFAKNMRKIRTGA